MLVKIHSSIGSYRPGNEYEIDDADALRFELNNIGTIVDRDAFEKAFEAYRIAEGKRKATEAEQATRDKAAQLLNEAFELRAQADALQKEAEELDPMHADREVKTAPKGKGGK